MILAAGRGTRLGPLGLQVPKALVDVAGEPLLARHLRSLEGQGATRVVVNAHHLADQVHAFAAAYAGPLELVVVEEPALLGTAGGVRHAVHLFDDGPFVVLYGDVLVDEPLRPLLDTHVGAHATATLAVYAAERTEDKGVVDVDEDGRVTGFREKPPGGGPGLVNAGLYVLDPAAVAALPADVPLDFGFDVFPAWLAASHVVVVHRLAAPVVDIGTPDALAGARRAIASAR